MKGVLQKGYLIDAESAADEASRGLRVLNQLVGGGSRAIRQQQTDNPREYKPSPLLGCRSRATRQQQQQQQQQQQIISSVQAGRSHIKSPLSTVRNLAPPGVRSSPASPSPSSENGVAVLVVENTLLNYYSSSNSSLPIGDLVCFLTHTIWCRCKYQNSSHKIKR